MMESMRYVEPICALAIGQCMRQPVVHASGARIFKLDARLLSGYKGYPRLMGLFSSQGR
jgi:hypothetical protein